MKVKTLTFKNRFARVLWGGVWRLFYRPSPVFMHGWRRFILRCFGAKVGKGAHPYPTAVIWAPWNLEMAERSCLGHHVICYSVDKVRLGKAVTVSQYSYLCTASHDYKFKTMPLVTSPVVLGDYAWVTADVFVGPGVTIGEGAVVGARSTITKDVPNWTVVAGSPPVEIGKRSLSE